MDAFNDLAMVSVEEIKMLEIEIQRLHRLFVTEMKMVGHCSRARQEKHNRAGMKNLGDY